MMKKIRSFIRRHQDEILIVTVIIGVAVTQYIATRTALNSLRVKEVSPSEDLTVIWVTYADGHEDIFHKPVKK